MISVVIFAYVVLVIGFILCLVAGGLAVFGADDCWLYTFALRAGALCIIFWCLSVAIAFLHMCVGGLIK